MPATTNVGAALSRDRACALRGRLGPMYIRAQGALYIRGQGPLYIRGQGPLLQAGRGQGPLLQADRG